MGDARDINALSERMKTMQAENETLKADLTATLSGMRTDMARRDAARSERDATARWWQTAIMIAAVAALITFAPDLQRLAAGP